LLLFCWIELNFHKESTIIFSVGQEECCNAQGYCCFFNLIGGRVVVRCWYKGWWF